MHKQHRTPPLEVVQWLQEEIEQSARLTPEDLKRARVRAHNARQNGRTDTEAQAAPQREP